MPNLIDSDESDDDDLLHGTTFGSKKKTSRKEEARKRKNENCLDQYINEETKRSETSIKADQLNIEDNTDDDYWSRVQNAVKEESYYGSNGNDNDANDDNDDNIENHPNDDNMLFDNEKRMKDGNGNNNISKSSSGGLYLALGVRNMFCPTKQNPKYNNIQLFSSEQEIIKKLSTLRSLLGKRIYNKIITNPSSSSPSTPKPKRGRPSKKTKKTNKSNNTDNDNTNTTSILSTLLYSKAIVKAILNDNTIILSRDVFDWLWSISCSGSNNNNNANNNNISTFLIEGSCKTLVELIKIKKCDTFVHTIDELYNGLNGLFGLIPDYDDDNDNDYSDIYNDQKENIRTEGIINFLRLWCGLFQDELVVISNDTIRTSNRKSGKRTQNQQKKVYENFVTITCNLLVSLIRCNLDTCFHCGLSSLSVLQQLTFLSLQFINKQLETTMKLDNNDNDISIKWIQDVTPKIISRIFQSIPKPISNTNDKDDPNSFIAFSLAIRNIPICDTNNSGNNISTFCTKFKAQIVKVALEEKCCFLNNDGDDGELQKDLEALGLNNNNNSDKVESLSWKDCMIVSKKIYYNIEYNANQYVSNGPRFYATVCLANVCADMGDTLFHQSIIITQQQNSNNNDSNSSNNNKDNNSDDGDVMTSTMEALEFHCINIKQQIKSVFTHPHLRRVKEVLTWYSTKYRHAKVDIGKKMNVKKQRTLDVWLGNDDNDNSDNSDNSDENDDNKMEEDKDQDDNEKKQKE